MTASSNLATPPAPSESTSEEDHRLVIIYQGKVILALDLTYWKAQAGSAIKWLASRKEVSQPDDQPGEQTDRQPVEAAEEPGRQLPPPS